MHRSPRTAVAVTLVLITMLSPGNGRAGEGGASSRSTVAPPKQGDACPAPGPGTFGKGTTCRQWVTGPGAARQLSPQQPPFVSENVEIPMRDGVLLNGQVFHPPVVPGQDPGPCAVTIDGYGGGIGLVSAAGFLQERRYPLLTVASRGTGGSMGEHVLYDNYAEDGFDIIEWAADQPWCNGNVGLIGPSLLGITQWLAAKTLPPSLKAFVPHMSCGDCYWDLWYPGGMLPGPGRQGRGDAEYGYAIQHRNFDERWRNDWSSVDSHDEIARAGIPALISDGWNDYFLASNVHNYEDLVANGGTTKLIIGPWAHGTPENEFVPYNEVNYEIQWFDRYMRGMDNGVDKEPPVLIYVEGPDMWRFENAWPLPDARTARMYLRSGHSGSIGSRNDGSLRARRRRPPKQPPVSIGYSPDAGPFLNANPARDPDPNQSENEAEALTWTTKSLASPTEVTGWSKLRLWASANTGDWDFVVMVTDVAPDGTSTQVTRGFLNAPRFFSRTNPSDLVSGRPYRFDIEVWPQSHVYEAGHRIRISIAGGATQESQAPGLNPNPAEIRILQGGKRASFLEVPVVGTARLPNEANADRRRG